MNTPDVDTFFEGDDETIEESREAPRALATLAEILVAQVLVDLGILAPLVPVTTLVVKAKEQE